MWKLWLGALLFAGPHVYSSALPAARDSLRQRFGVKGFKGLFALVALAGLVLLALAYLEGRSGPNALEIFYEPAPWTRHANMLLSLLGFILMAAMGGKGYIKKAVKHPQSLGVALWSIGHLLANGERAVVVIFASLLVIALADIVFSLARGKVPTHEPRIRSDVIAFVAGVAVYLVMALGFHPYVLNIPVVP